MVADEQQLASLVLLLRLPAVFPQNKNNEHDDGTLSSKLSSSVDDSTPQPQSQLQKALEDNDCNLLLFIGRLIHSYNNAAVTSNDDASHHHALLRLAIHVLFLRYAEETGSSYNTPSYRSSNNYNSRVLECEQYLLRTLLPATLRARASLEIEQVDVEMVWIMRGILLLLLRYSQQQAVVKMDSKPKKEASLDHQLLWMDFIDALMNRRLCKGDGGSLSPMQNVTAAAADDDDKLMVQTIHSILDGGVKSIRSGDESNNNDVINSSDKNDSDWSLEFSKALVDSIQSFLQHTCAGGDSLRLKLSTMFGMIRLSQQSDALSVHVYLLLLQYLRLRIQSSNNSVSSFNNCFVVQEDGVDGNKSEDFVKASIRSFIFYGMVVLGNTVASSYQQESIAQEVAPSTISQMSLKGLRAEIYTLATDIWRSFGLDWLFYDSTKHSSSKLSTDFWWFRSQNTESQLGSTWPFCTLAQLAAGDLRLNLGRWMTLVEDDDASFEDNQYVVSSEIESCATVILETVQFMTSLADDIDGDVASGVWVPEALLHIRKSLEDALNSSVQYLNSFSCDQDENRIELTDQRTKVGRICCVLVGTIASELEVEDLLISPSIDERNMQLTKEAETSCFASALAAGMLLCHSVGEKNVMKRERLETCEPLCCLLPCIMSVVACSSLNETVQNTISSLCEDGRLVHVMSQFLLRAGERWKRLERLSQIDEAFAILSITELCLLIVDGLVTSLASKSGYQQLVSPLKVWKEALLLEVEDALKEQVEMTCQHVDNCLTILQTHQ